MGQCDKLDFFSLLPDELDVALADFPSFRARQLRAWVYDKLELDPQRMTDLPPGLRTFVRENVDFGSADVRRRQQSADGTLKLLLDWPGGAGPERLAETVMIPEPDRRTACVSSQVGCPVGCTFCASGVGGSTGNLSAGQIVQQVFCLNREMEARVSHVVFMGMGEPMANYAAVMKAVRILHDPQCFNISARRITISTVGVPAKMRELAAENLPLNLAISLHAPNEALRKQLIPWANHFSLDEILTAAREYFIRTGREVTLEYILLAGVNDLDVHAQELAGVCRGMRCNVNLIRYNEVEGLPFQRPASAEVMRFQETLRAAGVNAHVRRSRGRDIDAACGQLRKAEATA